MNIKRCLTWLGKEGLPNSDVRKWGLPLMSNKYCDWENELKDHTHVDYGVVKKFQQQSFTSWDCEAVDVNSRTGYSSCDVWDKMQWGCSHPREAQMVHTRHRTNGSSAVTGGISRNSKYKKTKECCPHRKWEWGVAQSQSPRYPYLWDRVAAPRRFTSHDTVSGATFFAGEIDEWEPWLSLNFPKKAPLPLPVRMSP